MAAVTGIVAHGETVVNPAEPLHDGERASVIHPGVKRGIAATMKTTDVVFFKFVGGARIVDITYDQGGLLVCRQWRGTAGAFIQEEFKDLAVPVPRALRCMSAAHDCLVSGEKTCLELLMRKAQLMKFSYSSDEAVSPLAREHEGSKKDKGEERSRVGLYARVLIFFGLHKDFGEFMVAPDRLVHVANGVDREAGETKQNCKAREEGCLLSGDT